MSPHEYARLRKDITSARRSDINNALLATIARVGGAGALLGALAEAKTERIRQQNRRARRLVIREAAE
jgi:hypothetical protein